MTVPLIVLAILSTFGGLIGIPYAISSIFGAGDVNVFEHVLEPVIYRASEHKPEHVIPSIHATGQPETTHAEETTAAKPAEHVTETHSAEELTTERLLAGLSVLLALSGIGIGIALFNRTPLRKMPKILEEKWRIDDLYNGYIVDPITRLSTEGLWKGFDLGVIDGIVNGLGHFIVELGSVARQVQVGFVRTYASLILLGALVVLGYFIYFGLKLIG